MNYDQKSLVRPIVCEWDGSSTRPGPSQNTKVWSDLLPKIEGLQKPYVLNRRLGELIPTALTACVNSVVASGDKPMILGGDHRLTHAALMPLVHINPDLQVHHWDAHHDSHESATLNNYSVFNFIRKDYGVRVKQYGVREEGAPAGDKESDQGAHVYLSVDIDYIDPEIFSSVSYPLPSIQGQDFGPQNMINQIKEVQANNNVIGCDLVEWCSDKASQQEIEIASNLIQTLVNGLNK